MMMLLAMLTILIVMIISLKALVRPLDDLAKKFQEEMDK